VAAVADANHEVVQSTPNDWFLILDEPSADQGGSSLTYVDRLSVQNWIWVRGGKNGALNCKTGDCI
jgi:hypothetical protein